MIWICSPYHNPTPYLSLHNKTDFFFLKSCQCKLNLSGPSRIHFFPSKKTIFFHFFPLVGQFLGPIRGVPWCVLAATNASFLVSYTKDLYFLNLSGKRDDKKQLYSTHLLLCWRILCSSCHKLFYYDYHSGIILSFIYLHDSFHTSSGLWCIF